MDAPVVAVVDNDRQFVEMMAGYLGDEGYAPLALTRDIDAFNVIRQRKPTLIVLEISIADPDRGWMVLNKMRLDPQTAHIPVILATLATDLLQRNEENLRAKGCDMLIKPFFLEELLVLVGTYAPLARSI